MENENLIISERVLEQHNMKKKFFLGIYFLLSIPILLIIQTVISMIFLEIIKSNFITWIFQMIIMLFYPIAFILTLYGFYLIFTCHKPDKTEKIEIENIEYVGFWMRLWALIIDIVLSWLIIPLFLNLYFWERDGQTIGYKVIGAKIYKTQDGCIYKPQFIQLMLYPFLKVLNLLTLSFGYFMIGWTSKKQGLHNIIGKTVIVKVKKTGL